MATNPHILMRSPASANALSVDESWLKWQQDVLALIQQNYQDVLKEIGKDDIDWDAWRPLYDEGCSAQSAVDNGFARLS